MEFISFAQKNTEEKIQAIIDRNDQYSNIFKSQTLERRQYQKEHPTAICAFKCMDGRVHIPFLTKSPLGIIKPFRRLGGAFDLGWPHLAEKFKNWVNYQKSLNKKCLVLVSYHFSKSNPKRGCAGFNYDTEAAIAYTKDFKKQVERIFQPTDNSVFPIIVGLETDSDSLVLHSEDHKTVTVSEIVDYSEDKIFAQLLELYPHLPEQILYDLFPLIIGNVQHIKDIQKQERKVIDVEHKEWIVGIGTGFDWLHSPNTALIVGPWSPRLDNDLEKAFSIIRGNMHSGRIADDGFVIIVSSEWSEYPENLHMKEKVNFFMNFAKEILAQDEFKDISDKAKWLPVIVDTDKKFRIISEELKSIPYFKRY